MKFYKSILCSSKWPLREENKVAILYVSHVLTGD